MKDLRRILILRFALLIAIVLVAVCLLVILPLRSFTISQERERLEEESRILASEFERFISPDTPAVEIDNYLEELAGDLPTRLTIIDTEGVVLGDSETDAETMENHAGRPEIASALEGGTASSARESRTLGRNFIYAASPIEIDDEIVGVARVSLAEEDVMPVVLQIWWIFLGAFGFLLVVIVGVSFWTEHTIVRGLGGMREAAAGLAAGDLTRRVTEPDIREFSELARDLNDMADRIRSMVQETAEERGKLEAVINNISAGVMVTDAENRIVLLNPAAERILEVEQEKAEGSRIIEAFSSPELDVAVSRAARGKSVDEEIELVYPGKMYLHLKSNPVFGPEGEILATVSAIEDVTAVRILNRVRQDFVANVSHELRTPVGSIKALTDTLLDGAMEQRETARRFLDDLDHEATRLSQLIEDLLTLSKLEAKEASLKVEDIQAAELLRECLQAKSKLAEDFNVTAVMADTQASTVLRGDRRLLKTALNNLVDNAVKYNLRGGKVSLSHRLEDDEVVLEVADNGIGIPREELPRIFERFYRLDKARSRETGGTGLGLSIVKHIAELHGGGVSVDSEEGEGSTFRIHLPLR